MTNTQTPPPATTIMNPTGAPVTNTMANHAERPEKFNDQNFKRWQQKMFFYLTTLGLARFLKETVPQVEPPAEGQSSNAQVVQAVEAWKHSDFLCHNYVLNVQNRGCWYKEVHGSSLLDYKMVDSKNVISQVQDLQVLIHDIHAKGMTLSETFQAAAIIEKLPQSWVEFKNYLKHKRKEMGVEDLVVRLRIEEDNMLAQKDTYTPDSVKANMIEHVGSSSRFNPKGKGKGKRKNDKKSKRKSEYLAPKARIANMVNDDVDMIAMVSDVCAMISEMTFEKELKLTNVLYVLEIRKNLVSGWLLNKFGFRLVFESDKFVLSKNQMYVGRGYAMDDMFKLNVMVVKNEINKINTSAYLIEFSNVWHARLGHVNLNSMRRLIKFNSIPNCHIDSKYKCETCVEAKLTRTSFKSVRRKTKPLDMVHTDICDLKSLATKGGNKVMFSPNHPTFDIEDAFSSNFSNYILASPDYSPASPRNTPESSNNSYGLLPMVSPTISFFHDDPYMKVIHAYDTIIPPQVPIQPTTIMPPSPILSPIFKNSLFPRKYCHQRNEAINNHPPLLLPYLKHLRWEKVSRKTNLERHEEQIKEILNHLDKLSLDRIEHIEGLRNGRVIIQQDFKNLKTKLQEARAQISKLQRKQMGNNNKISLAYFRISTLELIIEDVQCVDSYLYPGLLWFSYHLIFLKPSVAAALEAQATNTANTDNTNRNTGPRETLATRKCTHKEFMSFQPFNFKGTEGAVSLICWFERTELVFPRSNYTEDCKVNFSTGTLTEEALSWWNSFAQPEEAYKIAWSEFKKLLIKKYCPELRIEGKKPSELMLSTQLRTVGILETFPYVEDVDYITPDFAVLCVRFATKWATRLSTAKTKSQPLETTEMKSRVRIAQSSALPPVADEPASPIGDDSEGEACPTDSGLEADQDRANITKTSTLPSDSTPRVTSLATDEGTSILTSRGVQVVPTAAEVATATVSIPTGSGVVSTASPTIPTATPIFTTATESTPYTRRKGKEKMVESATLKKKKLQVHIDVQVTRELEEEMARDVQRMNEHIARDAEIARIHAEEELQMMFDGLDRNNETVAKYLQEYHQFATELPIRRRIELISDLVKYQDNYAKVHKFQAQQRKPLTKKQQREFYTLILRNQAG
uniref:GAG-pre-integrase domain-containing protein n=1 Tax=Tanacetum cinerariifolium TaxID=118510 RepID=A0A6L2KZX6_TANCI|nr:hypothetical protein [Tanacetum cinerariifolium]